MAWGCDEYVLLYDLENIVWETLEIYMQTINLNTHIKLPKLEEFHDQLELFCLKESGRVVMLQTAIVIYSSWT